MAAISDSAAAHQATRAQVALAWVLHHPNTVAIPGERTPAQIEENLAATELSLEEDEFARPARLTAEARGSHAAEVHPCRLPA